MGSENTIRLDKWLWAARFFKTRRLAADAITGGKIQLNGHRAKPGKEVRIGSQLTISKGPYRWEIAITTITKQRRPAKEAILLYDETPESHLQRQKEVAKKRQENLLQNLADKRPNKKQRRQIHRFTRA